MNTKKYIKSAALLGVVTIAMLVFSGCDEYDNNSKIVKEQHDGVRGEFLSQEFDGHIWITWWYKLGYGAGGGLVHHPECPCGRKLD